MAQRYQQYPAQQQAITPFTANYTPQYDPAMQQLMADTLSKRQERYDVGSDMIASSITQFGGIDTVSPGELEEMIGKFTSELDEIGGGDPGMNIRALKSRIAAEAANPFYNMNRYQVEQAKIFQQQRMQMGASFMPLTDPTRPGALQEALETENMSGLEAKAIKRDPYDNIIMDLSKRLTPEQEEILLQKYEGHGIEGFLQHGNTATIDRETRRRLAEDLLEVFKGLAPSIQHEKDVVGGLDPAYEWTQDDDAIIDRMVTAWSSMDMKQSKTSYMVAPQVETGDFGANFPPFAESPTFPTSLKTSDVSKEVKESEKVIEAANSLDFIHNTLDILSDIDGTIGGINVNIGTDEERKDRGEYAAYAATSEQRERWSAGQATTHDALDIFNSHIRSVGERTSRGIVNIYDQSLSSTQRKFAQNNIKQEVTKVFNVDSVKHSVIRDDNPTPEERVKRSELLELVWPIREQYDFDLVRNQDGLIDFDFSDLTGRTRDVNRKQGNARRAVARDINKVLIDGESGIAEKLSETQSKIQEFIDKNPIVEEYYQQIFQELQNSGVPDQEAVVQALTTSIETLTNTQKNRRAVHATSIHLDSTAMTQDSSTKQWSADDSARKREETRFLERLNTFLGHSFTSASKTTIRRRDRTKSSDMSAKDFSDLVTDNPITSARVIPINGLLEVKLKGESDIFYIDLKETPDFLPTNAITKINEVQSFIQTGTEFKDADVTLSIPQGEARFIYTTITDEETNQFVPVILGFLLDGEGNPVQRIDNAESYFNQFYKTFIFNSILGK